MNLAGPAHQIVVKIWKWIEMMMKWIHKVLASVADPESY